MAEYIEREALIAKLKQMKLGEHGLVERLSTDDVYAVIAESPAVDVAPVMHGDWLLRHIGAWHYWECSVCHTNPCIDVTERAKFCPNCGARMDRGVDNGNCSF